MIVIDSFAQLKLDTMIKVFDGRMTINNAAKILNRSRGAVERYVSRYRVQDIKFVAPGNTGKTLVNKTCVDLKKKSNC